MADLLFDIPATPAVPVLGTDGGYPVRRIFCVGRNYVEHAREMGQEVDREAPFYFTKSPAAMIVSEATAPYPPGTGNYHHEIELVVALGAPVFRTGPEEAAAAVFGYAVGLDMTRRDLQQASRVKQRPWDTGKDVENSAVIGPITPAGHLADPEARRIWLAVNGTLRQDAVLGDMVWPVVSLICDLSRLYRLGPGDLIYTGTPAGVGPVQPGDVVTGGVEGLEPIRLTITDPE